jgi:hypothetical protein
MITIFYELGANVQPRRSLINTVFSPVAGATTQVAATARTMLECGCERRRAIQ